MKCSREHKEVQVFFLGGIILSTSCRTGVNHYRASASPACISTLTRTSHAPEKNRLSQWEDVQAATKVTQWMRPSAWTGKDLRPKKAQWLPVRSLASEKKERRVPTKIKQFQEKKRKPNDTGSIGRREERRKEGWREGAKGERKKGRREGGRNGLFSQHPSY